MKWESKFSLSINVDVVCEYLFEMSISIAEWYINIGSQCVLYIERHIHFNSSNFLPVPINIIIYNRWFLPVYGTSGFQPPCDQTASGMGAWSTCFETLVIYEIYDIWFQSSNIDNHYYKIWWFYVQQCAMWHNMLAK